MTTTLKQPEQKRYREVISKLQNDIASGVYAPGKRLPSVRALCAVLKASTATVTHALHLMEDKGLIEARSRTGFFVRCPAPDLATPIQTTAMQPRSQVIALSERRALTLGLRARIARNVDDRLSNVRMEPSLYPAAELQRSMSSLARSEPKLLTTWTGHHDAELEIQLAKRYSQFGCAWTPKEIFITANHMEAVCTFLRLLTKPGDVVAVQSPSPMVLLNTLDQLGVRVLEIPTDPKEGLSVETLAFALKQEKIAACVFEANFPNPTGSLMSDEAKRRTVELLAEYGVPLIEDDKSGEIYFGATRPLPFKAFDQSGNVYYCGELGFLLAPGLGGGFAVTGNQRSAFHYASGATGAYGPPPLIQRAFASFIADGLYERHLRRMRQAIAQNMRALRAAVETCFPAQTRMAAPQGGVLLWVELPRKVDTARLLERAMELGIGFVPGRFFSADDSFKNCLRLNAGFEFCAETASQIASLGRLISEQIED